ncbi:IS3 family transposase [Agrobacterium radiobacter]|nr:IS3 family transposase [Agrobacterium tumefaciens]MQB27709.1 transposase [Agrobacterium tumefaciens]NTA08538.1 transposase [Agrobacterium tumefaciens]NTA94718.1 transposase [Agrobacterium tumefaciens]NTB16025.1 transposase [Agrobacterium tumefaciens]SPZ48616.1 putative IS3 family transposase, IS3 group, OrfB [Agrobacterium tumefaciens]
MIDLPRSTYYYRSTAKALNLGDSELIAIIEDIQDELPCYGYRRVTHELQRRGHLVNHKRVARVMRANGLGIKPRKWYVRTTDSNHDSPIYPNLYRNVIPVRPDTSRISASPLASATLLSFSTPAVARLWVTRCRDAWIHRWHWQRCIRPLITENLLLAAFITPTADAKADSTGRRNTPNMGGVYCDGKTEIGAVNAAKIILARSATCMAA